MKSRVSPFLLIFASVCAASTANVDLQLQWAARELRRELHKAPVYLGANTTSGAEGGIVLVLANDPALESRLAGAGILPVGDLVPQAFAIRCVDTGPLCFVVGGDGTGVQYGALHLIDAARVAGKPASVPFLLAANVSPFILHRGLKLNAPLDARTPSYCDCGDNAQANIITMWDPAFWTEYFDVMIRMRLNALSLWQDHPFPSLTHVPEYPDIGYDDVMRANFTSAQWRDFNALICSAPSGNAGTSPEVLSNLVTVVRMTLDEKIEFWRNVTASGAALGIDIRFVTWSVQTALAGHGMPGIATPETAAYTRAATRAFLTTYPALSGVGITAGENMTGSDDTEKEAWLWNGTGLAVNDVASAQPTRQVSLVHRVWQTELSDIIAAFEGLAPNVNFDFAFKYCAARCYTVPNPQVWADAKISLPPNSTSRFWWTLRNDDVYQLRWGDVEFIRAFMLALPGPDVTRGYWVGSDGWAWAREFTSLRPRTPVRELEIDKHWLVHTAWGLMGYDPTTPRSVFAAQAAVLYPQAPSGDFMLALSENASAIVPTINQFYWEYWDFQWNAETCARGGNGNRNDSSFVSVDDFRQHSPLAGSGMVSVKSFVDDNDTNGRTPPQVADALEAAANATLAGVAAVTPRDNVALQEVLGDYTAFAHLGKYYACKIRAAVFLEVYENGGGKDKAAQAAAVAALTQGSAEWRAYAATMAAQYAPVTVYSRTGLALLAELQVAVDNDIAIVLAA